jgi:DNA-binding LytR/AlgR family response regulator
MLNIILCDDDKFILQLATDKIKEEIINQKLGAQIVCVATDSVEVFQYIKCNPGSYLIFLDLDFGSGKLNGIDVAKRIKSLSVKSKIVFATNHQEMAMQVLSSGAEPFGFLEKTTDMKKLSIGYRRYIQMAMSILEDIPMNLEQINLTVGIDETVSINKGQLLYVDAEKTISHGVSYHTMDGSCITVRDTIENVIRSLGDDFIRIHRSVIANKKHMIGIEHGTIRLSNGEEIPCAIRMRNEVKKWLT